MDLVSMLLPAHMAYAKNFVVPIDEDAEPILRKLTKTTNHIENSGPDTGIDLPGAVDIGYMYNAIPPRLIGQLKKYYPKSARQQNIEAVVNTELYIGADGIVKYIRVIGIRLSKELPTELQARIENDFKVNTIRTLKGAQFTPFVLDGKNVPIKMEMPVSYQFND